MVQDYGQTKLKSNSLIFANEIYKNYMFSKWTPILLDLDSIDLNISDQYFTKISNDKNKIVKSTYYGINNIRYEISTDEPVLMVENKICFSGRKVKLDLVNSDT